jgi:hypothetical protein
VRVSGLRSVEVRSFLAVASSLALISSAFGQAVQPEVGREVSRIQRQTLFRPPISPDEERALARELRQREEYGELRVLYDSRLLPWFALQIFSGAFYTTNAALLPNNEMDTWYFQQGLNLNWTKGFLASTLFPHASFYQAWFEYARPGVQGIEDFSAMDANVGVTYILKKQPGPLR